MRINYFKAAEEEIASLPKLKKSIKILERKKKRIAENGTPTDPAGVDYTKPYINSTCVNETLNEILEISEITTAIEKTKQEIDEIEYILGELKSEQKMVLEMFYIDGMPAEEIAKKIFVESAKTVYNIRNRAISEYVILSYGAAGRM